MQSLSWIEPDFDTDDSWQTGATTIGYDLSDKTEITTEVSPTLSLFLRKEFNISQLDQISVALLHIDFDDAFVAYLNGVEIARVGLEGSRPSFDTRGSANDAVLSQGLRIL